MINYIPQHKSDLTAVKHLQSFSFEFVKKDVPKLLECIQDMHWDIGWPVAKYLVPHVNEMTEDLLSILKTKDEEWKYNVIRCLIADSPNKPDPALIKIIKRIAEHPTPAEIEGEVNYAAKIVMADSFLCG